MKLTYRGVQYDYTPPVVEMNNTAEAGKYRGVDIRFRSTKKHPVQQPTLDLIYRGAAYRTGATVADAAPVATTVAPIADAPAALADLELKARTLLMGHNRNVKRRQQAMLTRLASDVGFAEGEVGNYWNRIQGKVHPSFWATYDRGGSSAS